MILETNNFIVKVLVTMLAILVMTMFCGCTSETNLKMSAEGRGSLVAKYGIEKELSTGSDEDSVDVNEIIASINKNIPADVDLKATVDTKSSKEVDYVVLTLSYNSLEEFDKSINALNEFESEETFEDVSNSIDTNTNIEDSAEFEKEFNEALTEYLAKNNITIGNDKTNYDVLAKLIKESTRLESAVEEFPVDDEWLEEDEVEVSKTIITKDDKYATLKVQKTTLDTFNTLFTYAMIEASDLLKDLDLTNNIENPKEIYTKTFEKINLADKLNKLTKNTEVAEGEACLIEYFSAEDIKTIFTEDFEEELLDVFTDVIIGSDDEDISGILDSYDDYEEETELNEDDFSTAQYNITFINQKVTLDVLDFYLDEDDYITVKARLDGKALSNEDALNLTGNGGKDAIDDTPKTADTTNQIIWCGILVCSAAAIMLIYKKMRKIDR